MSKFPSGLSSSLRSQMRGQIFGEYIPTLTVTFSRVLRVSTGADVSLAPSIEQSATVSECGRGCGCDRDFRGGLISFGGGRGCYGGRQTVVKWTQAM